MTNDSTHNDVDTIAALAQQATAAQRLEPGGYYVVPQGDGDVLEVDLTGSQWTGKPGRIQRTVNFTTLQSLLDYWDKYATPGSEATAVTTGNAEYAITAHLDASAGPDQPGWYNHIATTTLKLSEPLRNWLSHNNQALSQDSFGEWVEDNMAFIAAPPAATLLEMAEKFSATTTVKFQSGVRRANGQATLSYTEQVDGGIGDAQLAVPTTITLALPIWTHDTTATTFTARLRYRLDRDRLTITYKLDQPRDIINTSFDTLVATVAEHIGRPVFRN